MSQVLLQLVVTVRRGVCFSSEFNLAPNLFFTRNQLVWVILYDVHKSFRERDFFFLAFPQLLETVALTN